MECAGEGMFGQAALEGSAAGGERWHGAREAKELTF